MVENISTTEQLIIANGLIFPEKKSGRLTTKLKSFSKKRSATSLEIKQSPIWENWIGTSELGTRNMADAPVFLRKAPNDD